MTRTDDTVGKVVAMAAAERAMHYRLIAEVRAYWEALRKGHAVPARADVDPRGIERALENAFIVERIAPGAARFRLAGMHLNDLMGMEVRGMPLTSFFAPEARHRMSEVLEAVFQGPETAELELVAESGIGKPPLMARLLILPLKSDLGDVNRALGCLVSDGQIGRTPRRFVLRAVQMSPVTAGLPVPEGERRPVGPMQPLPEPAARAGFAEAQSHFAGKPALLPLSPEARRAMLRVVKPDE